MMQDGIVRHRRHGTVSTEYPYEQWFEKKLPPVGYLEQYFFLERKITRWILRKETMNESGYYDGEALGRNWEST